LQPAPDDDIAEPGSEAWPALLNLTLFSGASPRIRCAMPGRISVKSYNIWPFAGFNLLYRYTNSLTNPLTNSLTLGQLC
jgi:hypothetical protein